MSIKLFIFSFLIYSLLGNPILKNYFLSKKNKPERNAYLINLGNTMEIKILNVSGELYEYKKNQILNALINLKKNLLNAEEIKNITLASFNKSKLYMLNTECHFKTYNINSNATSIYCYLDLTKVPKGEYFISYFYYEGNIVNDRKTLLTVKEEQKKENKTEIPKLINVFTLGYEHMNNQNISLYFNTNNFNYSLINSITIYNNSTAVSVFLDCVFKGYNNSAFCFADFEKINSGIYNILFFTYNYTLVNVSEKICFEVYKKSKPIEDDLKLIGIYGDAFSNSTSLLNLKFNKDVNVNYFSSFYLTDIKPYLSYAYYLNFSFCQRGINSSVDCLFDFQRIPVGSYLFNFIYKNKTYPANITLTVQGKEIISENDLLEVYSNFKSKINNQTAYFTINGRNRNNNLAYIVLKDEYSNINVIQTLDCKIIDYDSKSFDLKCKLNLTYVNEGKYSISEYYINNQHFYTKKNIKVVVQ